MRANSVVADRLEELAMRWRVSIDETLETETSLIAYGRRDSDPVVVKVIKKPGDEWSSGEVLSAFRGKGMISVIEHVDGAMLLERIMPGSSLAAIALDGRDEEATRILADVIGKMSPAAAPPSCPTVEDWGESFDRYAAGGNEQIPRDLLHRARDLYLELSRSQRHSRLLHGDLHHYNTLFDEQRGWLAIDPKGVVGEMEYEIAAAFRNPYERPSLFTNQSVVEARLNCFAKRLDVDVERVMKWIFAQAVLSVIWSVEDGLTIDGNSPSIRLAEVIRRMLPAGGM